MEYRYKIPSSDIGRVDRIKRLSSEVLEQHKSKFGENFSDNKKILDQLTIIRSKGLKNEIAGYITKFIKNEKRDTEIKKLQTESVKDISEESSESERELIDESEEKIIEIGVDDSEGDKSDQPSEAKTE